MTEPRDTNNENGVGTEETPKPHTNRRDSWDNALNSVKHALYDVKSAGHSLFVVARDNTKHLRSNFGENSVDAVNDILADIVDQASKARDYLNNRDRKVKDIYELRVGDTIRVVYREDPIREIVGNIEDIDVSGNTVKIIAEETEEAGANGVVVEVKVEEASKIKKVNKENNDNSEDSVDDSADESDTTPTTQL